MEYLHGAPDALPHAPQLNCSTVAKMNDPGLDEPIQQTTANVEQNRKDEVDFKKEDEQAFLNPRYSFAPIWSTIQRVTLRRSRWWFASTAFPLLAVRRRCQDCVDTD
ncbi:MAG: hypothetical protein Q9201_002848 [Fulgogasparrea decipioides]